jgi:PLP dependent protein
MARASKGDGPDAAPREQAASAVAVHPSRAAQERARPPQDDGTQSLPLPRFSNPRYFHEATSSNAEPTLADLATPILATVTERLAVVRSEIDTSCREARRDPASVTLVAISKTFGAEAIEPVIAAGQRVFGENRVQEAKAKWPDLQARYPGIELHLVGPLQSNKAKEAVALFDAIHAVDRPSLAEALAKEIAKQGRRPTLFVEVNTGAEPQKAGVLPEDTDAFVKVCRETYGLTIGGLMCIPPANEPPAPHFALTAKIAKRNGLALLSMGMSADFALAVQFGATHVRVGSAIFGERTKSLA